MTTTEILMTDPTTEAGRRYWQERRAREERAETATVMAAAGQRTQVEINELKKQWYDDPCWDIETTSGFESHYDELLNYRSDTEAMWEGQRQERLEKKAKALGIPDNPALAQYVLSLEQTLARLTDRVDRLEGR